MARLSPPFGRKSWSCTPTRWLALSYFTYFFSYGIFLPFWSVWLAGNGLTPETIGILLG
ncbi:3-phenylpropionate MFS transporter, partial [Klebsiella pneumoniae]